MDQSSITARDRKVIALGKLLGAEEVGAVGGGS